MRARPLDVDGQSNRCWNFGCCLCHLPLRLLRHCRAHRNLCRCYSNRCRYLPNLDSIKPGAAGGPLDASAFSAIGLFRIQTLKTIGSSFFLFTMIRHSCKAGSRNLTEQPPAQICDKSETLQMGNTSVATLIGLRE